MASSTNTTNWPPERPGGGPVLVSWRDVRMAGDGYNVVIHELFHKLDMRNGDADGIPPLPSRAAKQHWEEGAPRGLR